MRAGFGKSDITPRLGVELAGFGYYINRRALSVTDPLYARAVALEDGGVMRLMISCDVLGLSAEVCGEVFGYAEKLGFKPENILIVSVHTHCGPAIKYHEGCGYTDAEHVAGLARRIFSSIEAACADMHPVNELCYSTGYYNGGCIYNRTDPDGPVDRMVRGFVIKRSAGRDIAMVSAACHGVFRGRSTGISADFSGEINRILEKGGMHSIYLNGLCGDIDPTAFSDECLAEFAQSVTSIFNSAGNPLPLTVSGGSIPFTLRLTPVTADDISGAAAQAVQRAGGADIPQAKVALIWEKEMLAKLDKLTDAEDIYAKYIILGGVPILALPFEGFTKIGMDIREICSRQNALILGCAEELLGYLPTKDDIDRGAYAALESTFLYKRLPVVPGEAERLGAEMGEKLRAALGK